MATVRLTIGCYEVFAGDAGSQGARQLIAGAKRPELVYGNDPAWRAVILDVRGELAGRSTAFRARDLARVASAALIAEALARNLIPCWSASNPISKRLAERLGYRPAGECEVLLLQ